MYRQIVHSYWQNSISLYSRGAIKRPRVLSARTEITDHWGPRASAQATPQLHRIIFLAAYDPLRHRKSSSSPLHNTDQFGRSSRTLIFALDERAMIARMPTPRQERRLDQLLDVVGDIWTQTPKWGWPGRSLQWKHSEGLRKEKGD